jgi:anti-sigma regulatory factor (Ser/Thr protein kinase)
MRRPPRSRGRPTPRAGPSSRSAAIRSGRPERRPRSSEPLIRLDLDPAERPARAARAAVRALPEPRAASSREDLELLVTELVANSERHARLGPGDRIGLRVLDHAPALRVEVRDPGGGFAPAARDPGPSATGGRGMLIVDRLARRWGVERSDGTCLWFELDWGAA